MVIDLTINNGGHTGGKKGLLRTNLTNCKKDGQWGSAIDLKNKVTVFAVCFDVESEILPFVDDILLNFIFCE